MLASLDDINNFHEGFNMSLNILMPDAVLGIDDDELGYIVTLKNGYSFDPHWHEGVKGFDTSHEVKKAIRHIYQCREHLTSKGCIECGDN